MEKEIIELLKEINPLEDIEEDTNLLENILDSVGLMLLISEIEEKYQMEIPLGNVSLEDFKTVKQIQTLIINTLRRKS